MDNTRRIKALTWGFTYPQATVFDRYLTAPLRFNRYKRAATAESSLWRLELLGSSLLVLLALLGQMSPARATTYTEKDFLKLYAHSRIINEKEYVCFLTLIDRESHWNPRATNGNHWGLGQMENKAYGNLDGFRQVDWTLRYIKARYSGSTCKALAHSKRKGWS